VPRQLRIDEDVFGFSVEQLNALIYMGGVMLREVTLSATRRKRLEQNIKLFRAELERRAPITA
jgi:hypothetical protein